MGEQALSSLEHNQLSLSMDVLSKLSSYEDYLTYYMQLDEASNTFSWLKADLLRYMFDQMGEGGVQALAKDIKQPNGTVANYIRVARAFPPDQRNPQLTFSHHFQASFADEWNDKERKFTTDKRFEWVNKAADENLSTRKLHAQIQDEKQKEEAGVVVLPCLHCGKSTDAIKRYVLYSVEDKKVSVSLDLHEECYLKVLDFIHAGAKVKHP